MEVTGNFQMTSQGWRRRLSGRRRISINCCTGKNKIPGTNASSYENPEYDKLYEQTRFMPNGPERFALFARMNEMIREDVPVILGYSPIVVACASRG